MKLDTQHCPVYDIFHRSHHASICISHQCKATFESRLITKRLQQLGLRIEARTAPFHMAGHGPNRPVRRLLTELTLLIDKPDERSRCQLTAGALVS